MIVYVNGGIGPKMEALRERRGIEEADVDFEQGLVREERQAEGAFEVPHRLDFAEPKGAAAVRRLNDQITFQQPVWKVDVSKEVVGKSVAVIDEIADTGETLRLVAQRVREQGAARIITACLVSHSWAKPAPDQVALVTDALVIFPWDKQVYQDGKWQAHPELADALKLQNKK